LNCSGEATAGEKSQNTDAGRDCCDEKKTTYDLRRLEKQHRPMTQAYFIKMLEN